MAQYLTSSLLMIADNKMHSWESPCIREEAELAVGCVQERIGKHHGMTPNMLNSCCEPYTYTRHQPCRTGSSFFTSRELKVIRQNGRKQARIGTRYHSAAAFIKE
jgi:hypothetical protein